MSHGSSTTTVLFDREIVRILNERCVMCHADDSLSFPLVTYEQTWLQGRSMRSSVLRRHMPPWPAVAGYGDFLNDNHLTMRETQFLVSWVEGLGPRNAGKVFLNVVDPKAAAPPEVRATTHSDHWRLGEPDLARQLPPLTIAANERDVVKRTVIDLGLSSTRQVRALEFMPGDRRVVRAVTFSVERTGQWLGGWTPWHGFVTLPDNVAYRVPAGTRIVADIHYRGASERVVDRGTLGLFFAKSPVRESATDLVIDARSNRPGGDSALNGRAYHCGYDRLGDSTGDRGWSVVARGIGETSGRWNRCPAPDRALHPIGRRRICSKRRGADRGSDCSSLRDRRRRPVMRIRLSRYRG